MSMDCKVIDFVSVLCKCIYRLNATMINIPKKILRPKVQKGRNNQYNLEEELGGKNKAM